MSIRRSITGEPPTLPGRPPPRACAPGETAAPPVANEAPPGVGPGQCASDADCAGGDCEDGHCAATEVHERESGRFARFWIGASLSSEVVLLSGASDVCKLSPAALPATSGYYCTNPDGSDYPSRDTTGENNALAAGNAGQVGGGAVWGDIRILASFDYAITANLLAGARLGVVAGGYSGSAAVTNGRAFGVPMQLEVRGTYVFGKDALAHSGFSPTLFVDGGVGRFDASTTTSVVQTGVPGHLAKTAWLTSGPGFLGLGGGARYQFSQRIAFTALLKLAAAFSHSGVLPSAGPEVAVQYGF